MPRTKNRLNNNNTMTVDVIGSLTSKCFYEPLLQLWACSISTVSMHVRWLVWHRVNSVNGIIGQPHQQSQNKVEPD